MWDVLLAYLAIGSLVMGLFVLMILGCVFVGFLVALLVRGVVNMVATWVEPDNPPDDGAMPGEYRGHGDSL